MRKENLSKNGITHYYFHATKPERVNKTKKPNQLVSRSKINQIIPKETKTGTIMFEFLKLYPNQIGEYYVV